MESIYKKGPYYTECAEMIDGLLVTKIWCGIAFNSRAGWKGGMEVFAPTKFLYFSTPKTAILCIF